MATIYSLVCENGSSGSYWSGLSTDGKARYGAPGSERVFSKLTDAIANGVTVTTALDILIIEIGDAFLDQGTVSAEFKNITAAKITVTTMINGTRTTAFHSGNISDSSGGYIFKATNYGGGIKVDRSNVTLDGFKNFSTHYSDGGISIKSGLFHVNSMIGFHSDQDNSPFNGQMTTGILSNCISVNNAASATTNKALFSLSRYSGGDAYIINCLALGMGSANVTGFRCNTQSTTYAVIGCAAYGCGVNWDTTNLPSAPKRMSCNAGEAGDTPWDTEGTSVVGITSADFVNAAAGDYRLTSGSIMIGASEENFFAEAKDIIDQVRPNYNPSGEENWDIGPFEYDHGNGLAPKTVTLEITNIVTGSELAIYKASDNSVIVAPQTVAGTSYSTSYTYTADTLVNIVLRNASGVTKYQPYKTQGNINENGLSVYVSQVEDTIAQ